MLPGMSIDRTGRRERSWFVAVLQNASFRIQDAAVYQYVCFDPIRELLILFLLCLVLDAGSTNAGTAARTAVRNRSTHRGCQLINASVFRFMRAFDACCEVIFIVFSRRVSMVDGVVAEGGVEVNTIAVPAGSIK